MENNHKRKPETVFWLARALEEELDVSKQHKERLAHAVVFLTEYEQLLKSQETALVTPSQQQLKMLIDKIVKELWSQGCPNCGNGPVKFKTE